MKIIKPLGRRCLIKPYQSAEKTTSGLILNNDSNVTAAPVRGTVIRVGDESRFKIGDEVFFRRYSVDSLKTMTPDGEIEVTLVDDDDCLATEIDE